MNNDSQQQQFVWPPSIPKKMSKPVFGGKLPSVPNGASAAAAEAFTPQQPVALYRVLEFIVGTGDTGCTDKEVYTALSMNKKTEMPRRRELQDAALIVDETSTRKNEGSRVAAQVWIATPAGCDFIKSGQPASALRNLLKAKKGWTTAAAIEYAKAWLQTLRQRSFDREALQLLLAAAVRESKQP